MKRIRFQVYILDRLLEEARQKGKERGISVAFIINEALKKHLKSMK